MKRLPILALSLLVACSKAAPPPPPPAPGPAPAVAAASSGVAPSKSIEVTFPSDGRSLHGYLYKPPGEGPFPAIVFNHGSEPDPGTKPGQGLFYGSRGYVVFVPHRRGQGLSPGDYIMKQIDDASFWSKGDVLVERLVEQVADVGSAAEYLKTLP